LFTIFKAVFCLLDLARVDRLAAYTSTGNYCQFSGKCNTERQTGFNKNRQKRVIEEWTRS